MAARNYSNIAVATTLSSGITDSATSLTVADATGWPAAPFLLVIDPDTASEELVLVGAKSGATFSSLSRGYGGTSAVAHNASDPVTHVIAATDISLIWTHDHDTGNDFTAVDHDDLIGVSANDHHNQAHDIEGSDHTASGLTSGHALVATGATTFGFAAVDHGNLAGLADDDHTQYLNVTRHDADDHSGLVTAASLVITESQISDLDHTDADAIHDNVNGEFAAITLKASPHIDDLLLIEDSEASNAKKYATLTSIVSAGSTVDHGSLDGLADDDHTQYVLADGSRVITGDVYISSSSDLSGLGDTSVGLRVGLEGAATMRIDGNEIQTDDGTTAQNLQLQPFGGQVNMGGASQVINADGSEALPGITFDGDANTGFYVTGNNGRIDWAGNGTKGGQLNALGMQVNDGSAASPSMSFHQDPDTGFYRISSNSIGIAAGGSLVWTMNSSGTWTGGATGAAAILSIAGSVSTPAHSFVNDADTGIYRLTANQLAVSAGGTSVAHFLNGGSGSSLFLLDGLTDVGNQTTLRMARGSGSGKVAVGYFSSWAENKKDIVSLNRSALWDRGWFEKIQAVTFIRKSTQEREFGFVLDQFQEIDDNLKYLTTGGDSWGDSPDEFGILAVTVDYVQTLGQRVDALEKRLSRA